MRIEGSGGLGAKFNAESKVANATYGEFRSRMGPVLGALEGRTGSGGGSSRHFIFNAILSLLLCIKQLYLFFS